MGEEIGGCKRDGHRCQPPQAEVAAFAGIGKNLGTEQNAVRGGQFRDDGEVSQLDIENTLRFNNGLTVLTVTAAERLALIEHGVAATEPGATPGRFPQVGGMAFSFDPSAAPNSRVRTLSILNDDGTAADVIAQNGAIVGSPSRAIRLVTLNFLAGGGDGYPFPATGRVDLEDVLTDPGVATFADPGSEQDALAEYLAANFTDTPFALADTPPEDDERIQNLAVRSDGVPTGALGKGGPDQTLAGAELPASFELRGNYPNPFNPTTTIVFDLPQDARVHVAVFDLLGRQVLTVPQAFFEAGAGQHVQVDGAALPSGVYLYRVTAESAGQTLVRKGRMMLLK